MNIRADRQAESQNRQIYAENMKNTKKWREKLAVKSKYSPQKG